MIFVPFNSTRSPDSTYMLNSSVDFHCRHILTIFRITVVNDKASPWDWGSVTLMAVESSVFIFSAYINLGQEMLDGLQIEMIRNNQN